VFRASEAARAKAVAETARAEAQAAKVAQAAAKMAVQEAAKLGLDPAAGTFLTTEEIKIVGALKQEASLIFTYIYIHISIYLSVYVRLRCRMRLSLGTTRRPGLFSRLRRSRLSELQSRRRVG